MSLSSNRCSRSKLV